MIIKKTITCTILNTVREYTTAICSGLSHSCHSVFEPFFVTHAPGEECEDKAFGSVCLSVYLSVHTRNSKTISRIESIFFTQDVLYPWLRPPARSSGLGSGYGLKDLLTDSSPLRDRTKYAINVCHVIKRALRWKNAL